MRDFNYFSTHKNKPVISEKDIQEQKMALYELELLSQERKERKAPDQEKIKLARKLRRIYRLK